MDKKNERNPMEKVNYGILFTPFHLHDNQFFTQN